MTSSVSEHTPSCSQGNPDPQARIRQAQALADRGEYGAARDLYRGLITEQEDNYALLLDYGNCCVECGAIDEAAEIFSRLTRLRSDRIEGWNNLGIVALRRGSYEDAREAFARVLELEPNNPGALVNMGNYHSFKGQPREAMECFLKSLSVRPDYADAWYNLGNAQLELGDAPTASRSFEKALRYNPEFISAIKNLGVACERQGNYAGAEQQYLRALALSKGDYGICINLANVYTCLGRYAMAKTYYLRAVRTRPRDMAGWMGLRRLSLIKGDVETFVRATCAVISRLDGQAIAESIKVLRELGQHERADQLLAAAEKLDKRCSGIDAERLLALQRTGLSPARIESLLKKLHTETGDDHIRQCLAEYYYLQGMWKEVVTQVAAMSAAPVCALRRLWQARIRLNDRDSAFREIEQYLQEHPDFAEGWYLLARIETGRGNLDGARKYLRTALESGFVDIETVESDPDLISVYRSLVSSGPDRP